KIDLRYEVRSEACDFIYNMQATPTAQQRVLAERLDVTPQQDLHGYTDPATHARYVRFRTGPRPLRVRCETVVELAHHRAGTSMPMSRRTSATAGTCSIRPARRYPWDSSAWPPGATRPMRHSPPSSAAWNGRRRSWRSKRSPARTASAAFPCIARMRCRRTPV